MTEVVTDEARFAVFYEEELLTPGGGTSWPYRYFGFVHERDARQMFELMQKATNHESRKPRGFRNVRLSQNDRGIWRDM